MNRNDLQSLAKLRLREARILLRAGQYSGAYYLCGYSIEYAAKACIARKIRRYEFPDKDLAFKSYSHNLEQLITIADLKRDLDHLTRNNTNFAVNWNIVKDWNEKSRYEIKTQVQAQDLYNAINNRTNGIFRWLRQHW